MIDRFQKFLNNEKSICFAIIIAVMLLRFATLGLTQLADTTEARYASIGMRMALSGNFITPMVYPDLPFLAKPPLSFWATAISFLLFSSFHEFFARLPHFLAMVGCCFYIYFSLKSISKDLAIKTLLCLTSSISFVMLAGSVMTDTWLLFSITIISFSFWKVVVLEDFSKYNKYSFFAGIGICMLAKGPVGIVISGIGAFFYLCFCGGWKTFFTKMPFFSGLLLSIAIFLPWYYMCQKNNPDFLEYFLIGEHIKRFLIKGWEGDRYGYAHDEPLFMIIPFFLLSILPWAFCLLFGLVKLSKSFNKSLDKTSKYFICCIIFPMLFFCFARNIIIPYATTFVIPFFITFAKHSRMKLKTYIKISLIIPFILIILIIANLFFGIDIKNSQKNLVKQMQLENKTCLAFLKEKNPKPQFSGYFYSRDNIVKIENEEELPSNCLKTWK